jgi:hypothetical protein
MKDTWMSSFYLNIGCAIITALVIDYLVLSKKREKDVQLDRVEKKLDVLMDKL